jgi:hypothetical protein
LFRTEVDRQLLDLPEVRLEDQVDEAPSSALASEKEPKRDHDPRHRREQVEPAEDHS